MSDSTPAAPARELPRVLGFTATLCVIVGSVIGSGIFIVPARVANEIPAMGPIGIAWVVGGLFCIAGVLTLAELAAMLPHAGGPYVFLREAYGKLPAFLFGWAEFWVIRTGSMAALAAAFAMYASQLTGVPAGMPSAVWQAILAISAMAVVATVNVLGTRRGADLQVFGTVLKVGALAAMIVAPFLVGKAEIARWTPVWPERVDFGFLQAFMVAMVGVLWAYDGWIHVSSLSEEIEDPARNIPRTLITGGFILILIYVSMSLVYHLVMPMNEASALANAPEGGGTAEPIAGVYCKRVVGDWGGVAIALVVMTSTFIALNGNVLSGPRAYFALARDGLFPSALARVHARFQTPANAIVLQTLWAMALTVVGTALVVFEPPQTGLPPWAASAWNLLHRTPLYDVLYTYVIFGGTVIYTLSIASVFVLRRKRPDLARPYKTWGYPITPAAYILAALVLLGSMLARTPLQSLAGLGILIAGIPAYYLQTRRAS